MVHPGRRKILVLAAGLAAAPRLTRAQRTYRSASQEKPHRVGVIALGTLESQPLASFVQGLRELGYEKDRNLELLAPLSGTRHAQLSKTVATALERKAEVLVTYGTSSTTAARRATTTVPIVMIVGADPVALGLVSNLARPEGNVTGLASENQVLIAKRLELMKEIVPGLKRIGALWNSSSAGQGASFEVLREAAGRIGLTVQEFDLRGRDRLSGVAEFLAKAKPDALMPLMSTSAPALADDLLALAAARGLPAIYADAGLVRMGGLAAYSPDARAQLHRAAYYVDRLLKGASPADLPVEQPTKFEFAINLKTARTLGIAVAPSLLMRADRVIE